MNAAENAPKKDMKNKDAHRLSIHALKGRQSVRATFKLPRYAIYLVSMISNRLGVQQKSLFDQLIEEGWRLDNIKKQIREHTPQDQEQRSKTFVLSRQTLNALNRTARSHNIPRDLLVEMSIRRLIPLIGYEKQKQKRRIRALEEIQQFYQQGRNLLSSLESSVGADDSAHEGMSEVLSLCEKTMADLQADIERGKALETFSIKAPDPNIR